MQRIELLMSFWASLIIATICNVMAMQFVFIILAAIYIVVYLVKGKK